MDRMEYRGIQKKRSLDCRYKPPHQAVGNEIARKKRTENNSRTVAAGKPETGFPDPTDPTDPTDSSGPSDLSDLTKEKKD